MSVHIAGPPRRVGRPHYDRRLLRARAQRLLRALGHEKAELSLTLCDDVEMAALNEQYRGNAGATDVLSFSLLEGAHAAFRGDLLGEVAIGIDVAARQARRGRRSLDAELTRLLIHGVLHLLGHDHVRREEARRMRAEERCLLRELTS